MMVTAAVAAVATTGCATNRTPETAAHPVSNSNGAASVIMSPVVLAVPAAESGPACSDECGALPWAAELAAAIEARVAELKARGGGCEELGAVLETALKSGHITVRPYMWRVEGNLASAQGESTGELTVARDIDSLNVGVRRVDDVLRSAEHEAAHIALRIPSGDAVREARVDDRVNSCRGVPGR